MSNQPQLQQAHKHRTRTKRETTNIQVAITQINMLKQELNIYASGTPLLAMQNSLEGAKKDIEKTGGKFTAEQAAQFKTSIVGVIGQVKRITSGDAALIAMGITESMSNLAALVPGPWGAALSSVLGISSSLIGASTGNNKGTGQIVDEIMKKNLKAERVYKLGDQITQAKNILENSKAFMQGFQSRNHSAHTAEQRKADLDRLGQQVKVKDGLAVLSSLENFITVASVEAKDKSEVEDVLGMARAYAQLTALRHSLMSNFRAIYSQLTEITTGTEAGIAYVIETDLKRTREILRFLSVPSPANAHVAAAFVHNNESLIKSYMIKSLNMTFDTKTQDELAEGCHYVQDAKDTDWYVHTEGENLDSNWYLELTDGDDSYRKNKFVKNGDHYEWRMATHPAWLFYLGKRWQLHGYEYGNNRVTEDVYLYSITKMSDDNYFISNKYDNGSTVYWWSDPNSFGAFWLFGGKYDGTLNPGQRAYWKITKTPC